MKEKQGIGRAMSVAEWVLAQDGIEVNQLTQSDQIYKSLSGIS